MNKDIIESLEDLQGFAFKKAVEMNFMQRNELYVNWDLTIHADEVCSKIQHGIVNKLGKSIKNYTPIRFYQTVGFFCLLSGMGAYKLWDSGDVKLLKDGIFETLSKDGIGKMEFYIINLLGNPWTEDEYLKFMEEFFHLFLVYFERSLNTIQPFLTKDYAHDGEILATLLMQIYKEMFNLGICYERLELY